jgi:hypothetical protein
LQFVVRTSAGGTDTVSGNTVNIICGFWVMAVGLVTALNLSNRTESGIRDLLSRPHLLDRIWPWKREAALDPEVRIRRRVTSLRVVGALVACIGVIEVVSILAR